MTTRLGKTSGSVSAPIVIVGGGFGGLTTALELARQPDHPPLLVIDPAERFVFAPLLYEVLSGELPAWTVAPRFDALLPGRGIGWLQDRVTAIDHAARTLTTAGGLRLAWQRLVLACGAEDHDHAVPASASMPWPSAPSMTPCACAGG